MRCARCTYQYFMPIEEVLVVFRKNVFQEGDGEEP